MKLLKDARQPLYIQLMTELKNLIYSGVYSSGDKIPTELELSELYEVSRITVRKTIEELCKQGYLEKQQGKGTFVKAQKLYRKIDMQKSVSFTKTCENVGMLPYSHVLESKYIQPESWHKAFLRLNEDEKILYIRRLRLADDTPIIIEDLYFPEKRFENFKVEKIENGSLFQLLQEDFGFNEPPSGISKIEAGNVNKEIAEILQINPGDAVLLMTTYWSDEKGEPFYIGYERIVGNRYRITI